MSLIILTRSPVLNCADLKRGIKSLVKSCLGQKRGPAMVTQSLVSGLKELGVDFLVNPPVKKIKSCDVLYVNESKTALRWAALNKVKLSINKLVAGPAIVNIPTEDGCLVESDKIDRFLLPSKWNLNWWLSISKKIKPRLVLWPAGVSDYGRLCDPNGRVLIFYKNSEKMLLEGIKAFLQSNNIDYCLLNYGKFRHSFFIESLKHCKLLVYLSQSESQGLALHEAWMAGVPTLVWNCGVVEYNNLVWFDDKISAPYMSSECGLFFKNITEFEKRFYFLINHYDSFKPRDYSLLNFSNKKCAQNFINIINIII